MSLRSAIVRVVLCGLAFLRLVFADYGYIR